MLAHLMPFETEKPSGSRKVWRAEGAGGGSGALCRSGEGWMGVCELPQRGSPTARGHQARMGIAAPSPCAPAGDPNLNGDDLPTEQQLL